VAARKGTRQAPLVLVIEDFEDTRRIYAEYLEFAGFRVEVATDGEEGIAKAFDLAPDFVVMDLAMPNLDGWEATKRLRNDPRTRDVYVLAVTGFSGDEEREKALDVGCDGVLTKPVLPAELVRHIVGQLAKPIRGPRSHPRLEIGGDSD
jgi:two-component system, cell cycle response regulator DivK